MIDQSPCYIAIGWILACPVFVSGREPLDDPEEACAVSARRPWLEPWLSLMLGIIWLWWLPLRLLWPEARRGLPIFVTGKWPVSAAELDWLDDHD